MLQYFRKVAVSSFSVDSCETECVLFFIVIVMRKGLNGKAGKLSHISQELFMHIFYGNICKFEPQNRIAAVNIVIERLIQPIIRYATWRRQFSKIRNS